MLPFMREQGLNSGRDHEEKVSNRASDESRAASDENYLTVAARDKNVRRMTYLLAVLFGIGLVCLVFMIKKSVPATVAASRLAGISTEAERFETALSGLAGVRPEMFSRMENIANKFYEFSDVQQVKVDELVKNPFNSMFDARYSMLDGRYSILNGQESTIENQAGEMQLLSIMATDGGNCCMIDDKILYKGDSIRGFKIEQISDSFVMLEPDEQTQDQRHRTRDQNLASGVLPPESVMILKLSE